MNGLAEGKCEACRADAPQVSEKELHMFLREIPDWTPVVREGILQLERIFKFKNFLEALAFTNRVADLAEANFHHPAILTEWGRVTITWWSHEMKGLHKNDFILAAKTDRLA